MGIGESVNGRQLLNTAEKKQQKKVQVALILCMLRKNKWTLERSTELQILRGAPVI